MTDALMMQLLRSGTLVAHHPLDPPHQCCWLLNGGDYEQCGLWCGHDGDHVPYTPGVYLPPPILHPLDTLRPGQCVNCPVCRAETATVCWESPFRVQRDGDGSASWYEPGDGPGDIEVLWRFEPCGCEGRELLPDAPTGACRRDGRAGEIQSAST